MYREVAFYPEARRLVERLAPFGIQPNERGYATLHDERLQEVFSPLRAVVSGAWKHCFASVIWSHGSIYPHCDSDNADGSRRFHVVLQNNPLCWHMHAGEWQQLREGGVYFLDPSVEHASINWGNEPRVHLIVDVKG